MGQTSQAVTTEASGEVGLTLDRGDREPGDFGVDGRKAAAIRLRAIVERLGAALGGLATFDAVDIAQLRLAAGLTYAAEEMTRRLADGEELDADQYTRVANAAARVLSQLRTARKPRGKLGADAGAPSALASYLADRPSTARDPRGRRK